MVSNFSTLSVDTEAEFPHLELRQRTMYEIIYPCLATIFTCTYISLHLNVPNPNDKWLRIFLRKLGVGVVHLLAPELVICWALRQHRAATVIAKTYGEHGWTRAHGFLFAIGGVSLHKPGLKSASVFCEVLSPERFVELLHNKEIDFPQWDAGWVESLGKADHFSKAVVVLQTTWFVGQCVIRVAKGLPLAQLEVVTLSAAVVNAFVYGLWWNKPVGMEYPVVIMRRIDVPETAPSSPTDLRTPTTLTYPLASVPRPAARRQQTVLSIHSFIADIRKNLSMIIRYILSLVENIDPVYRQRN